MDDSTAGAGARAGAAAGAGAGAGAGVGVGAGAAERAGLSADGGAGAAALLELAVFGWAAGFRRLNLKLKRFEQLLTKYELPDISEFGDVFVAKKIAMERMREVQAGENWTVLLDGEKPPPHSDEAADTL